jgi:hypothetical protein
MIYMKPLTLADRLLIETVTRRFTGIDAPFMAFDRGDHIELKCPARITMSPARLEQLKAQSIARESQSAEA